MKAEFQSSKTRVAVAACLFLSGTLLLSSAASGSQAAPMPQTQDHQAQDHQGVQDHPGGSGMGSGRGSGMGFMGGRGIEGTVTAATASEFTVKTELGESYKIQFNENTRFIKDRQPARSADIKVGTAIMAAGNIDAQARTVGAAFVVALDPDQVKRLQEARASYGKTWLAGKITAIDETKITIAGGDGKAASFVVDENTSFKKRKESITLADVKVGDGVTARGALKGGTFVATDFQLMEPRGERDPKSGPGGGPPPAGPNN